MFYYGLTIVLDCVLCLLDCYVLCVAVVVLLLSR